MEVVDVLRASRNYCLCWERHSERGAEGNACGRERDTDSSETQGEASHIRREHFRLEVSQHLLSTCEALDPMPPKRDLPTPHLLAEGLNYHIVWEGKKKPSRIALSHRAFYNNGSVLYLYCPKTVAVSHVWLLKGKRKCGWKKKWLHSEEHLQRLWFGSQHPHRGINSSARGSNTLTWSPWIPGMHEVHIHTWGKTHTYKTKTKKPFKRFLK